MKSVGADAIPRRRQSRLFDELVFEKPLSAQLRGLSAREKTRRVCCTSIVTSTSGRDVCWSRPPSEHAPILVRPRRRPLHLFTQMRLLRWFIKNRMQLLILNCPHGHVTGRPGHSNLKFPTSGNSVISLEGHPRWSLTHHPRRYCGTAERRNLAEPVPPQR